MSKYDSHVHVKSFQAHGDAGGDCAIRALAMVANIPYETARAVLRGGKAQPAAKALASLRVERITFPSVKGRPRMTPRVFCQCYPEGTFIVKSAGHVFVVRDGEPFDLGSKPAHHCVYAAWRVSRAA